jgi:hypothetical protein
MKPPEYCTVGDIVAKLHSIFVQLLGCYLFMEPQLFNNSTYGSVIQLFLIFLVMFADSSTL